MRSTFVCSLRDGAPEEAPFLLHTSLLQIKGYAAFKTMFIEQVQLVVPLSSQKVQKRDEMMLMLFIYEKHHF